MELVSALILVGMLLQIVYKKKNQENNDTKKLLASSIVFPLNAEGKLTFKHLHN